MRDVILADDFTGAGDSGIHFAQSGKRTALLLDTSALSAILENHQAVSLSTESRFFPPAQAAAVVHDTVALCKNADATIAFKKVDSTLRGNPGAEIEAALSATGMDVAVLCVSMPKTGRTCRDGILYLKGTPIGLTEIGRDPFNPVPSSCIAEIIGIQTSLYSASIPLAVLRDGVDAVRDCIARSVEDRARILIADGETDADLATLAQAIHAVIQDGKISILPVGAGGLAEAFTGSKPSSEPKPAGRLLAVIGSLSTVSLQQIDAAVSTGAFTVLELDMATALEKPGLEIARLVAEAMAVPKSHHLLIKNKTTPDSSGGLDTGLAEKAAAVFGNAAVEICRAGECDALYVTGGSTAVSVARALGLGGITLERECMPGIVLSSCTVPGMALRWFITKAGGFGNANTLVALIENMEKE